MLENLASGIIHIIQTLGYLGVFLTVALSNSLVPFPTEVTMPFTGFLVQKGTFIYPLALLAAATGDVVGSLVGYAIGYYLEDHVILRLIKKYGKFFLVSEHDYHKANQWFDKYGNKIVFIGKLLPGVRYLISIPAGAFKMDLKKFCLYVFIGGLIWCGSLIGVGYELGAKWNTLGPLFRKFELAIVVLLVILVLLYIEHKLKLSKKLRK